MINNNYKSDVLSQISDLRLCHDKIQEHLTAIELLMVDTNNSRVKDPAVFKELTTLTKQIDSVSNSIASMEKKLM